MAISEHGITGLCSRRRMIKSLAAMTAVSAIPSTTFAADIPDWRMIIGGCRSGKTTMAANEVNKLPAYTVMAFDHMALESTMRRFLPLFNREFEAHQQLGFRSSHFNVWAITEKSESYWTRKLERLHRNNPSDPRFQLLWADEVWFSGFSLLNKIAPYFKKVIVTTWPSEAAHESEFYKTCKSMGTVRHMPMLGKYRAMLKDSDFTDIESEFRTRVLGQFNEQYGKLI